MSHECLIYRQSLQYIYKRRHNSCTYLLVAYMWVRFAAQRSLTPLPPGPPGVLVSIRPVVPGHYAVRAIATTGDETFRTDSFQINIPSDGNSCSAHFKNRGVSVVGNSATIEFDAVGGKNSFSCREMSHQDHPETCAFGMIMWIPTLKHMIHYDMGPQAFRSAVADIIAL